MNIRTMKMKFKNLLMVSENEGTIVTNLLLLFCVSGFAFAPPKCGYIAYRICFYVAVCFIFCSDWMFMKNMVWTLNLNVEMVYLDFWFSEVACSSCLLETLEILNDFRGFEVTGLGARPQFQIIGPRSLINKIARQALWHSGTFIQYCTDVSFNS